MSYCLGDGLRHSNMVPSEMKGKKGGWSGYVVGPFSHKCELMPGYQPRTGEKEDTDVRDKGMSTQGRRKEERIKKKSGLEAFASAS